MKTFFTLASLFILSSIFSQSIFRTGISTATRDDDNQIFKVIQLSDGSYVGVGTRSPSGDNPAILLVKLNSLGSVVSSKVITSSNSSVDDEGVSIIATFDGGFAVSGTLDDLMTIVKLDANLNLQWQKGYATTSFTSQGTRLVQTSDGGYIIVGALYNTNDSSASYLVKTDSQGNVSFSKQYSGFNSNGITDIKATNDGNYALLMGNDDDNFNDTTNLVKIKPDGSILWSRSVKTDSVGNLSLSLLQASDGGFVTSGLVAYPFKEIINFGNFSDTITLPFPQIMMNKFDASGSLLWSKKITSTNLPLGLAYSAVEDKDGGYIFSGSYSNVDTSFQSGTDTNFAYLFKLSSSGNLVWTKTLNQSTSDFTGSSTFLEMSRTSDGGIVVGGTGYQPTDSDFSSRGVIYKFNSSYDICGSAGSNGTLVSAGTGVVANISSTALTTTAANITVTTTSNVTGVDLCSVLPVQLLSFKASLQNKNVNIEWQTANEVNADYFTVERSSNGSSFTSLQRITAKGGSQVETYTTTDFQPLSGTSYYRLKEVDKDGAVTYSSIVPVTVLAGGTIVISPNPVHNTVRVLLQSQTASQVTLRITDLTGKTLATQSQSVNEGINTINIPAASLSKGIYVLKVTGNNVGQSIKFIKE